MASSDDRGSPPETKRPFWPTRQEAGQTTWLILLLLFLPFATFAPLLLLLPLVLLPAGDEWGLVAIRFGLILAFAIAHRIWIDHALGLARRSLVGRLSAPFEEWLQVEEPLPTGRLQALRENVHLVVFFAIGVSVLLGSGSSLTEIGHAPGKFGWIVAVFRWSRGNPNTTTAAAALIAIGSALLCVRRVYSAGREKPIQA